VTSPLSGIPIPRRRQLAATLALFAALFVAVGAVAMTGHPTAVRAFGGVALVIALLLGLMAWGVLRSMRIDAADRALDAAIDAAVTEKYGSLCSCGHEHDPNETHITDACAHGGGEGCERDCTTCVLAAMRPSPRLSRAERLAAQ
jgi:ABC-type nickel/cobalt efflux system permease component RcnA